MKKFILILLLSQLVTIKLWAQLEYRAYKWSDSPTVSPIEKSESSYPAIIIKEVKLIEHALQYSKASTYNTVHRIIHINNDAGIEKHNRIFIPIRENTQIIQLQVRAISPTGKVTLIQRENIKELHNIKGYNNVKIFAIEGLEVGGEAEYLYTSKSSFVPFGREIVQQDIPVKEAKVSLFYPSSWSFKTKSYNGLQDAIKNGKSSDKNTSSIVINNIPAFHEEEYALYQSRLMRFEYKLHSNGYKSDLFTWRSLGERLVSNLSTTKAAKTGFKYVKEIQNSSMSTEEKVRALENKIKSTIKLQNGLSESLGDPKMIVKNGVGSTNGISKLYIYCLSALGIKNELVFTCNRYRGELDPNFANPSDISDMLIYFPDYKTYLIPDAYHMRYGVVHTGLMETNAFHTQYSIYYDKLIYSNHYFRMINALDKDVNHMGVIAEINFDDDMRLPTVEIDNYAQGYRGFTYRSAYHYGDKSGRDEFMKQVALSSFETFDIQTTEVEGTDITLSSFPEEYFRIKMKYTTPELIERAGNEYLVAIGKVIGKQSELYQEKERQHDISFHSISNYHHEITINIPDGYEIDGLENIKINNTVKVGNKEVMYFISDFTETEKSLTITVDEVYSQVYLSKTHYNDFRKVVNSAADFNKLTLVLKEKEISKN